MMAGGAILFFCSAKPQAAEENRAPNAEAMGHPTTIASYFDLFLAIWSLAAL